MFLTTNVYVSFSDYQLIHVSSIFDFMVFRCKPREGTIPKSPIKDVPKNFFWIFMQRKLKMLVKAMEDFNNHVELKRKMCLMNGNVSIILIQ